MDDTYKLGVIASSSSLVSRASELAQETEGQIEVSLEGLDDAIPVGKRMEAEGVEVIVSRGGTSGILRSNLKIPVLSIPLTAFDILHSVKKAASYGKKIMIPCFNYKISGIDILAKLFKIKISQRIYHDRVTIEKIIREAKQDGAEVIIGGGVSQKLAAKYKLQFEELHTTKETLASIIGDAKSIARANRLEREKRLRYQSIIDATSEGIIAVDQAGAIVNSEKIERIIQKAIKFAGTDSTILITGETGTGKEILAQGIHNLRSKHPGPFVSINCSALPEQLLESELFGYDEGAFTGSRKGGKAGLFELAHDGTIFLDEIGTTPKHVQDRLLRVLQEKEVMRIGGDRILPVNVRVIAATNKDLSEEVRARCFREDLFFRLNVLNVMIPPLRERIEDIPLLVKNIINRISKKYKLTALKIPNNYIDKLKECYWPGNVRQLENFLESLLLLSEATFDKKIFNELYAELYTFTTAKKETINDPPENTYASLQDGHMTYEAEMIRSALNDARYSKTRAAKILGISRATLWRKMKALGMK